MDGPYGGSLGTELLSIHATRLSMTMHTFTRVSNRVQAMPRSMEDTTHMHSIPSSINMGLGGTFGKNRFDCIGSNGSVPISYYPGMDWLVFIDISQTRTHPRDIQH